MSFLALSSALWAAALAVPVLIALYLLKLRRRPLRVASILFWPVAKEDVQANVPLRMIRPSWLLLLHALILLCLLAAMARPTLDGAGGGGGRCVLVIDTSASMSAVDAGQTRSRLDRARERAREIVDQLRRGGSTEVAVIAMAADAFSVTGFSTSRPAILRAIDAAAPTDQPGNLGAALQLADAMSAGAEEASGESPPPTVILLSDGAFRPQGRLPTSSMRLRFERIGPAIPTDRERGAPPDNVGIVNIASRRDPRDPGVCRVFVGLLATSRERVTVPILLSLNGREVTRRAVDVPGTASPGPTPGRATTTFEVTDPDGGVVIASVLRDDALAADNRAAVVAPPAIRPDITLVQDRAESMPASAWLLADALAEMRSRTFSIVPPRDFSPGQGSGGAELVVFDGAASERPSPVPSIVFGSASGFPGLTLAPVSDESPVNILLWQRAHPVLRHVALDSVIVGKRSVLRWEDTPGVTFSELMRCPEGPIAVLAEIGSTRHILTGFQLSESNWPLQAGFPIFLANALDYLTLRGEADSGRAFATDEPVMVRVRPGRSRITLTGPAEITVREEGSESPDAAELSAGVIARAGVYLTDGRGAEDRAVAVNVVDEVESSVASPAIVQVAGREIEGVTTGPGRREIWAWFVAAAVLLLAIEWLLYSRGVEA